MGGCDAPGCPLDGQVSVKARARDDKARSWRVCRGHAWLLGQSLVRAGADEIAIGALR